MQLRRIILIAAAMMIILTAAAFAQAQTMISTPPGPDFMNTLGVGSRAIAMGNAFTAIADDASATFWNPGRLGELRSANLMIEMRNVMSYCAQEIPAGTAAQPDILDPGNIETAGTHVKDPRVTFAGLTKGFGDFQPTIGNTGGTLGISWAVGGYLDYRLRTYMTDTVDTTTIETYNNENRIIQNSYGTVAWGKNFLVKGPRKHGKQTEASVNKVGLGLGYLFVQQDQSFRAVSNTVIDGEDNIEDTGQELAVGHGNAYLLGVTFEKWGKATQDSENKTWTNEPLAARGRWRFGATYRSKITLSGLSVKVGGPGSTNTDEIGEMYGREIPSRATLGVAYEWSEGELPAGAVRAPKQFTASFEAQRYSSVNSGLIDERKSVMNYHLGFEYIPAKPWLSIPGLQKLTEDGTNLAYVEPIRFGFHTNKAGNVATVEGGGRLFEDDNVISAGFGILYGPIAGASRGQYEMSIEPTIEYLIDTKKTFITITGVYRF